MFEYIRSHLGTKVSLLVALICIAVFTGLTVVSSSWMRTGMVENMDEALTRTSELIKLSIEKPMVVGNDQGTKDEFKFLQGKYPDVDIYLTNFKGNITYSTKENTIRQDFKRFFQQEDILELSHKALKSNAAEATLTKVGEKDMFVRVMSIPNEKSCHHCHGSSQPILGEIVVMQDVSKAMSSIDTNMYEFMALCVAGLLALLIPVVIFLRKSVLARIRNIALATEDVASGNLDAEFNTQGVDELSQLGSNLATMVAKLKNQLGFSEGVLRGITLPCAITGPDNRVIYANQQICDYLEKPKKPEDYVGVTSGELFWGEEHRETLSAKSLKERKQLQAEVDYPLPSGKQLVVGVTTTPFFDMDGEILGTLAIWFDLTEIRTKERQIQAQNERIASAAAAANTVSNNVSSAADELAAQVDEASAGSDEQQARTSEVATAMEEMNATVLEVAQNAGGAAELADQTKVQAQTGREVVDEAVSLAEHVATQAEDLKTSMSELGSQAEDVGRVIEVIEDIADQTNLLALNAAIEAARAGDAGRGFAVVADEVRKLAERTMAATQEVTNSIKGIQDSANNNIRRTEEAAVSIGQSQEKTNLSGEVLMEIVNLVERTADQVRSIATAAEQQSATSEQITRSTEGINSIAADTAHVMTESAKAVAELAEQAQELRRIIEDMQQ